MSSITKRAPSTHRVDHAQPTRRSVYSSTGTDRLGDIEQRDATEFIARDRRGSIIGAFDSMVAATAAVSLAARDAS